jgi:hypothetical protein
MKNKFGLFGVMLAVLMVSFVFTSCKKDDDGNGNNGKTDPSTIAASNLVAYFPFDGNGVDEVNGLTPSETADNVTYTPGRRGEAYQGADNAYLLYNLPSGNKLRDLKAFSIAMWFYGTPAIDGVAPVPGIIQIGGTSDPVWGNLCLTQDRMPDAADTLNIKIVFHKEGAVWANQFVGFSNSAFVENMWMHIVFAYDNATSKYMVYVNGEPLALGAGITDRWAAGDDVDPRPPFGDLAFNNATQMSIGGWMQKVLGLSADEWMGYFTGKMDELRIYDKGLNTTEVSDLFKAEVSQIE